MTQSTSRSHVAIVMDGNGRECAYAELWFTPTMWPDFDADELARALAAFTARERRFGALPASAPAPTAHG